MKYHLHKNGWTVFLDDFDIASCTQDDVNLIARLVAKYTLVVIRNQFITAEQEVRFVDMFGDSIPMMKPGTQGFDSISVDSEGKILRVTGEKNTEGETTGIAGHDEELTWHCNVPYDPNRNPIVYLRGVKGTKGSITEWNNTIVSYGLLSDAMKDKLKPLKMIPKKGAEQDLRPGYTTYGEELEDQKRFDFVYTNIAGEVGLYFPYYQMSRFDGMTIEESKLITDPLFEYVIKPEFCYRHDWEDGDVVIAEQWLGIHRRLEFDKMNQRVLHRAGLEFPKQDYSRI